MTVNRTTGLAAICAIASGGSYDAGQFGLCLAFGCIAATLLGLLPFIAKDFP